MISAKAGYDDYEVMMSTTEGIIIRILCSCISVVGRIASGVKLMDVDSENVSVASIAKVREQSRKEEDEASSGDADPSTEEK